MTTRTTTTMVMKLRLGSGSSFSNGAHRRRQHFASNISASICEVFHSSVVTAGGRTTDVEIR